MQAPADARDCDRLQLGVAPLLEKSLEFLNDCLDDIVAEQQKARAALPALCVAQRA